MIFLQGGPLQAQNYGAPAGGGMTQAPASASSGGAPAQPRPRVRARRGQATDPHSIAERVRGIPFLLLHHRLDYFAFACINRNEEIEICANTHFRFWFVIIKLKT